MALEFLSSSEVSVAYQKLAAAVVRIVLTDQIPLGFQTCGPPCGGSLIDLKEIAQFGLGDTRMVTNSMDEIKLGSADALVLHFMDCIGTDFSRDFGDLTFCQDP